MNTHYNEYRITFDECFNESYRSFDTCPDWAKERMAKSYWLSLDKKERLNFLAYFEEQLMDVLGSAEISINQAILEEALIDFYGNEINKHFEQLRRYAA